MNFDGQRTNRVLVISFLLFVSMIIFTIPCHGWHQTLTFVQRLTYDHLNSGNDHHAPLEMKFFMWYKSYAIYGARETLILLKPDARNSSVEIFSYKWPIDQVTMDECLQEWRIKDQCYNDVVHVRILPNSSKMDVYCTYAYQPMVRSFDLHSMAFIDENVLTRDPHPPMDSESSYVMLTFDTSIVTAGYQGDYIPTIRGTHGKTLLYALRQNSYFVGGFKYDGKAVFGVIETSERAETNRVSRLVMACANRAEIVRKATLNCSTDAFDPSRSFVFHILTALVDPIRTANGSTILYTTFTTNNSSITASAVCLFVLDKQFYDVFTGPSWKTSSLINSETNELIHNCSQSMPSTIDRDLVESQRQFSPYLSRPLFIDTISTSRFTAINVIEYLSDVHCLLIGTSNGRLLTSFVDGRFETNIFEELTLPIDMRLSVKSITHQKIDNYSYVIIITNHIGYLPVKLTSCKDEKFKLCFECWFTDCLIRRVTPTQHDCSSEENTRIITLNDTKDDVSNQSLPSNWSFTDRSFNPRTNNNNNNLLFYIVAPMSLIVFILSMSIIVLLIRSTRDRKRQRRQIHNHRRKIRHTHPLPSHTYTNNVMYRTSNHHNNKKLSIESSSKNQQQQLFPIKSEICIRSAPRSVYSAASTHSLPPLILPTTPPIPKSQPLSVRRLYRSYV